MKTIKRIALTLLVIATLFTFTSCIDIFQNITLTPDNNIDMTVRFTVSKMLFELGESDEPIEDVFAEEFMSADLAQTLFGETETRHVSYKTVNTEFDYGANIQISYPKELEVSQEDVLFPRVLPHRIEIKPFIGDSEEMEQDPYAMMFFSSMKYRLQLSKNLLKTIEKATLVFKNGESYVLDPIDLAESFLFEVPLVLLMSGEDPTLIFEY
ncbi:MAG: hypothetical protein PHS67_03820 [Sphaerochaetaceae bacterium]|nr:hypothetical protein [Sphaerochaetaceae bacterium]